MRLIEKQDLFAAPTDIKQIENWIERHPPEERLHLYTAVGMYGNFLSDAVENHPALIAAKKLLTHSLVGVPNYKGLTSSERSLITQEEYDMLVEYLDDEEETALIGGV